MATRHWTSLVLIVGLTGIPLLAFAQSPPNPLAVCQDQLRGVRVYAERLATAKQADDLDAAQTIARLIKQVEALQAEIQQFKKQQIDNKQEGTK